MSTFKLITSSSSSSSTSVVVVPKTLTPSDFHVVPTLSFTSPTWAPHQLTVKSRHVVKITAVDSDFSSADAADATKKQYDEDKETIRLPGVDYKHWLIVLDFPKDPSPTRNEMIDTYLKTLADVLGSMEEAKKNMYAFSTTTYTGFQCTVDEETSEKFRGKPGVLWVLPDCYLDVKLKDYGGDKYIDGEIIPCNFPAYQPTQLRNNTKYVSRRYERRTDGPLADQSTPKEAAAPTASSST
ncbi:hypothetical protein ACFE04_020100 [Oxalis oulophora]